ncbi:MAG: ABC transporter permease [Burkholderiales bacterium]
MIGLGTGDFHELRILLRVLRDDSRELLRSIPDGLTAAILDCFLQGRRVTESVTTQVRSMDFVEAARASGATTSAIIRTHILGNVLGPVLVYATVMISISILIAAGLSFIGLGATPPTAEWGLMLNTLRESIFLAPLNAVLPGFMIFVASMCFNLISDGLRSAMDVRF